MPVGQKFFGEKSRLQGNRFLVKMERRVLPYKMVMQIPLLFKEREKKDEILVPRLWVKNHLAEWHFVDPHSIKRTSRSSDRIIAVLAKYCNTV